MLSISKSMAYGLILPVCILSMALLVFEFDDQGPRPHSGVVTNGAPNFDSGPDVEGGGVLWLDQEIYSDTWFDLGHEITLQTAENDPFTPSGELTDILEFTWSVNYTVNDIANVLGPHEFVVLGTTASGEKIVEGFAFTPADGSLIYSDFTLDNPQATVLGGGQYVPSKQRPRPRPPRRKLLYSGTALGNDPILANDPDKRFTYAVSRDTKTVNYISTTSGVPVSTYAISDTNFDRLSDVLYMGIQTHATEGAKLVARLRDSSTNETYGYLLLSDYDGDGKFDADEFVAEDDYSLLGYPGLWTNDFVSKLDFLPPQ
jgi:hypothetical protein